MMAEIIFLLSLSIVFPLLVGILRRKIVLPAYGPLLLLFCLGLVAELSTRYAVSTEKFNWIPANNVYILLESLLIPTQFFVWGYMRRGRTLLKLIAVCFLLSWIAEHLIWGDIYHLHPYFRMFYSLVIVLLGINAINFLVIHEEKNLLSHPVFIACTAFIIFFTYQLVYEGIYNIVTNLETIDTGKLNTAFSVINFVCNILYGIALILVPSKRVKEDWFSDKNSG